MTTLRWLILIAAAAVVPSCGREHEQWLWVTVRNDGATSAYVWAEVENVGPMSVWYEHAEPSVSPAESTTFGFRFEYTKHLRVRINRASDGLEILNESWDRDELEALDRTVRIAVTS
jgi:hypothetical protein